MKTIDEKIQRSEESAIKKLIPGFTRGSLSLNLIDAFFRLICKDKAKLLVPSAKASVLTKQYRNSTHEKVLAEIATQLTSFVEAIWLPVLTLGQKWALAVVDPTRKTASSKDRKQGFLVIQATNITIFELSSFQSGRRTTKCDLVKHRWIPEKP